jgi:hypothetical protein
MNAASVDEARASPSKKRTKGTLPPMIPTRMRPNQSRLERGLGAGRPVWTGDRSVGSASSKRMRAATPFFAVV